MWENIEIIAGLIAVAIFNFFSLKFYVWKLAEKVDSLKSQNTRMENTIKSIDRVIADHETRISKIEKKLSDFNGLDFKKASDQISNLTKKQEIFLKFLAKKNKELDK